MRHLEPTVKYLTAFWLVDNTDDVTNGTRKGVKYRAGVNIRQRVDQRGQCTQGQSQGKKKPH